ncbi:MAG: serine/threonine-protein kinase [Deltaproteobacteria bacterium]|nr:serine/threonine-protein kinase [Deltaproteobacteria bacterium]
MPAVSLPQPQDRLGQYRLLYPLGQGGMASVFVAEGEAGPHKGERVACKILLPHLHSDERWRAQLFAEAHTTAAVQHDNVIRVLDIPEDRNAGFFVMQWRDGLPLDRLLALAGKLEVPVACTVLAQAARGLAAAHAAKDAQGQPLHIVHRDVSPHNLHVGSDGIVKLLDFGIAAAQGHARLTRTGEFKGKLAYVAPEQITRSHPIDFRCDLWALGLVAYEVLTGRCLFAADDEATTLWNVTAAEVPTLAALGCAVDPALAAIIEACVQRDPAHRPARAADVAQAFEAVAAEPARLARLVQQHTSTVAARPQPKPARRKVWFGVAAIASAATITWLALPAAPPKSPQTIEAPRPAEPEPRAAAVAPSPPAAAATPPSLGTMNAKRRAPARTGARPPAAKPHPDLVSNPYKDLVGNPY